MNKLFFLLLTVFSSLFIISCSNKTTEKKETSKKVNQTVQHADWSRNAVIYEVNIRQFSPEGNFKAFEKDLPRLKELGVDILWIMPIYPVGQKNKKGSLGSPYAVKDYKAVNSDYGTMTDFKALVEKAHKMGFKVILDWVANHTAWDNKLMVEHKDWYTLDSAGNPGVPAGTDWHDVADLNYEKQGLRNYMTDAMKFWIEKADVDGFRCDVAGMVPVDFWDSTRMVLQSVKPIFMLAEAEEPELQKKAFDMTYGWEFHHIMNEIAQKKQKLSEIPLYLKRTNQRFPKDAYRMYFTSNHDENTWNGTVFERMGKYVKAMAVLSYAMPGMPLIYNGQEVGLNKRLSFFDKDTIDWTIDTSFTRLYTKLNLLKHRNKALLNGSTGGKFEYLLNNQNNKVATITRTKENNQVLFVINFSNEDLNVKLKQSNLNGEYRKLFTNKITKIKKESEFSLAPYSYQVFYK